MEYILNQYYYFGNEDKKWITPIDNVNIELTKNDIFNIVQNITLKNNNNFENNSTYYGVCYIYNNTDSPKVINIKLKYNNDEQQYNTDKIYQYITTITIPKNKWQLIDFTFTPQDQGCSSIVFEVDFTKMQQNDYAQFSYIPIIIPLELSIINNLREKDNEKEKIHDSNDEKLITGPYRKIGVQSKPGFRMIINNEEIMVGRTGVYELKNPDIQIQSFGVIQMAQFWEEDKDIENIKQEIETGFSENQYFIIENDNVVINNDKYNYISKVKKERLFNGFTLDYIYEKETEV